MNCSSGPSESGLGIRNAFLIRWHLLAHKVWVLVFVFYFSVLFIIKWNNRLLFRSNALVKPGWVIVCPPPLDEASVLCEPQEGRHLPPVPPRSGSSWPMSPKFSFETQFNRHQVKLITPLRSLITSINSLLIPPGTFIALVCLLVHQFLLDNKFLEIRTCTLVIFVFPTSSTSFISQIIIMNYVPDMSSMCLSDRKKPSVTREETTKQRWEEMEQTRNQSYWVLQAKIRSLHFIILSIRCFK